MNTPTTEGTAILTVVRYHAQAVTKGGEASNYEEVEYEDGSKFEEEDIVEVGN